MTIEELRRLNDDDNYNQVLKKIYECYDNAKTYEVHYNHAEDHLDFWSNMLDQIEDENIKQLCFVLLSEISWYKTSGYETIVEELDNNELKELENAFCEGRLFISPFNIGAHIATKDDPYTMEVKEIIINENGFNIKAERYECVTSYDFHEYELSEKDLKKYNYSEKTDGCKHTVSYDW